MLALLRAIESQIPSMLDMGMNMDMGAGGAGDGLTGNQLTAIQGRNTYNLTNLSSLRAAPRDIYDFRRGDKISLTCDEMGEYQLVKCKIGSLDATCIYFIGDGQNYLIAQVFGADASRLDLMDSYTFDWVKGSGASAVKSNGNDYLFGAFSPYDRDDTIVGGLGSDVIIALGGNDAVIGVDATSAPGYQYGAWGFSTSPNPGRGEIDVLIGAEGDDTFVLGVQERVFYIDADNSQSANGYAAIQDFQRGDKIQLACDEMGDYQLRTCTVGFSAVTCIYYVGEGHNDLIAQVQGPDVLNLDLMDSYTFQWSMSPAAFDAAGDASNNIIMGGVGNDLLFGRTGSDVIVGGSGNDIIIGVDALSVNPGRGETDVLIGADGNDTFVLGSGGKVFYLDAPGKSAKSYAAIQDFENGDKIQLSGVASDYTLSLCTVGYSQAACIYYKRAGYRDELIAMVQSSLTVRLGSDDSNSGTLDLSLTDGHFVYDTTAAPVYVAANSNKEISGSVSGSPIAPVTQLFKTSITSRPATANQVVYVELGNGETADTLLALSQSNLSAFKARAKELTSTINTQDFTPLVGDASASGLGERAIALTSARYAFFQINNADMSTTSGSQISLLNTLLNGTSIKLSSGQSGFVLELVPFTGAINDEAASSMATAQSQGYCLLDFTGFSSGDCITGEVAMAREASFNSTVGFYRVLDVAGSVLADSILGTILSPGQAGYAAAALANRVSSLDGYQIGNRSSSAVSLDVRGETGMLAPYALVNGSQTFFAYAAANPDGINHFALIGNNRLGFEDMLGGGDRDFDDLIIEIRPTNCVSI